MIIHLAPMKDKNYHDKYVKYKRKYLDLKSCNSNNQYNFKGYYILHGTRYFENIISILTDGEIKAGKYVSDTQRSGANILDNVFANIYFKDIRNLDIFWSYSIVLHPRIIYDLEAFFNEGWQGGPGTKSIHFMKSDDPVTFNNKIEDAKKFVKNPHTLPKLVQEFPTMTHEIVFSDKVPIKKYVIGIICNQCDDTRINQIKKVLKDNNYKNYKNIKIVTNNQSTSFSV